MHNNNHKNNQPQQASTPLLKQTIQTIQSILNPFIEIINELIQNASSIFISAIISPVQLTYFIRSLSPDILYPGTSPDILHPVALP